MPEPRPIAAGLFETCDGVPRLRAARCASCDAFHFPASHTCPYCSATTCAPTLVGPAGTLRLFTAVSTRPAGYRGTLPFGFGVVELDGTGLQVIARLTESDPARLCVGQPVSLVLDELCTDEDGAPILTYAFRPETAS